MDSSAISYFYYLSIKQFLDIFSCNIFESKTKIAFLGFLVFKRIWGNRCYIIENNNLRRENKKSVYSVKGIEDEISSDPLSEQQWGRYLHN